MTTPAEDAQHLRLLSIFHYIVAGMTALWALFPIFHLVFGVLMASGVLDGGSEPEVRVVGWFFVAFASVWIVAGLSLAACMVVAGRSLAARRRHLFCMIVAGLACAVMPCGTILGVFTLVVLLRPSVKALFESAAQPTAASPAPRVL